jgi:hypothetical protein
MRATKQHNQFLERLPSRTVGEQHKLEDGALGFVRRNPQPAIMGFDDRTADRQTHPHTVRFCREQRIEYPLELMRADF